MEPVKQEIEFKIGFCVTSDKVRIAYSTAGRGPSLVIPPGWVSHLQLSWDHPAARDYLEKGTKNHTFVTYDKQGCGLSERSRTDFSLESEIRPLETVVDHLKLKRFALFGYSQSGPVAIAYSVKHPKRVSHLILFDTYACGNALAPDEFRSSFVALVKAAWGIGSKTMADMFLPGGSASEIEWFVRLQRESTTADMASKLLGSVFSFDVTDLLPKIKVPTLVIHRRGDKAMRFHCGRDMAAMIPKARFVPLEGNMHIPFFGDANAILRATAEFLGDPVEVLPSKKAETPYNAETTSVKEDPAALKAQVFIDGLDKVALSQYRIIGDYNRYEEEVRNTLKDIKQKIISGFGHSTLKRENHLIWAPPGTGKTYFVQQVAASISSSVQYREINLAKMDEVTFRSSLSEILNSEQPCLSLIDEVDAKPKEPWPYELLLPYLDTAVKKAGRFVFVLAGSSGSTLLEMKEGIASRPKGSDLLSRIPSENEHTIAAMSLGDRLLVALAQFKQAGVEVDREVREVEKLGLFYIALSPHLLNARQLREFAVRGVERMPAGDDRIKYDHLFNPGDPENKAFWMRVLPSAKNFERKFILIED